MSYYTGRGDYYSGKGDPGFGSILGGIIGTVGKVASAVVPGVGGAIGSVAGIASRALTGTKTTPTSHLTLPTSRLPAIPTPGLTGVAQRLIPGGASGYQCGGSPCGSGYHLDKQSKTKCVRNRRTNYANPKALNRAASRIDGFVKVARGAMKHTNYKVVSKTYKHGWRKPLKRG